MRFLRRLTVPWLGVAGLVCGAAAVAGDDLHAIWTIDDVVLAESASGWTLSRDGSVAVWVRSEVVRVDQEEKAVSNLWVSSIADGTSRQLTRGHDTVSDPAIAPDGSHVAFLSTRTVPGGDEELGRTQAWVIPLAGGEAYPVTRFDRAVEGLAWLDPTTLVAVAKESPTLFERERKQLQDDSVVVDDADHEPPVRLFRVPIAGGATRRITDNRDWIESLAVSPDGRRVLVVAQQSLSYEFDERTPPHVRLVDPATGTAVRILEDGVLRPDAVRWAPDSAGFYFTNQFSRHPVYRQATVAQLWYFDLAAMKAARVDLDWERGLGGRFAPAGSDVVALLADGVRFRPVRFRREGGGWRREDLAGDRAGNIQDLAVSADGRVVVFEHSSATQPPQWYTARLDGTGLVAQRKLTDLNPRYAGKPTGRAEVIRWRGARDEQVEGILHFPLVFEDGKRYPLVLDIHGGPAGTDTDAWTQSWSSPNMLWRQRGAFVLQANYHGSAGYGLDWVESISGGRYYELEIPDLERGVDELVRRGLVDPDRLASSGWSNGGILTVELISRTRRYRAASVGAADVEWISDWGNVDFGAAFDNYYLGGAPWEIPQVYMAKSPLFRLSEVTTPTLIATGTDDTSVPPSQSRSLFRALQQIGKAPVRLVLFPGEEHALERVAHQRRKVEEDVAWFDRYLFAPAPENEAVKGGSLLAGLLERANAARVGSAFGTRYGGVLVPETVALAGLEVGRFEITRAQFAAFRPEGIVGPDVENLPVTAVALDDARAYAAWLAATTGRPFRLPTVDEAARLAGEAGTDGNTLDRWAGYAPNPDDAERLLAALSPLQETALLLPVGSLAPAGEDGVFDLDGNAAEWATAPDGSGKLVGASADRPVDARAAGEAAPAYAGFRVVVGRPGT